MMRPCWRSAVDVTATPFLAANACAARPGRTCRRRPAGQRVRPSRGAGFRRWRRLCAEFRGQDRRERFALRQGVDLLGELAPLGSDRDAEAPPRLGPCGPGPFDALGPVTTGLYALHQRPKLR